MVLNEDSKPCPSHFDTVGNKVALTQDFALGRLYMN